MNEFLLPFMSLLTLCQNTTEFCIVILYQGTLLNFLIEHLGSHLLMLNEK